MVKGRRIVFRTDASIDIGTGHVMRCLTLAHALRERGALCSFVTRSLRGHLAERITGEGFDVTLLPTPDGHPPVGPPTYAAWAGVDWRQDAEETWMVLAQDPPRWLVIDHYAFDARWQRAVRPLASRLMVIDDLADRPHDCDLLLDQNLGHENAHYRDLVPEGCVCLTGPKYVLLRPEFANVPAAILAERTARGLRSLLITMGGVDKADATTLVLRALQKAPLPEDLRITVVMGSNAPALEHVRFLAQEMPWPTEVAVDVTDMAVRMAAADLAISAGGGTTWERLFLQLPSLVKPIARNQVAYLKLLEEKKLVALFESPAELVNLIVRSAYKELATDAGVEYGTPKIVEQMCRLS